MNARRGFLKAGMRGQSPAAFAAEREGGPSANDTWGPIWQWPEVFVAGASPFRTFLLDPVAAAALTTSVP